MEKANAVLHSRGMVPVESQTVSMSDIEKVNAATTLRMSWPTLKVLERRCLYYELDGRKTQAPLGQPGHQLEAVWEFHVQDEGPILSELLKSND